MSTEIPCVKCGRNHNPSLSCDEKENSRVIFTEETLRRHLEGGGNVEWVELKDLLADRSEACVDGRGELGVVGVPGGNAGEFLLALSTYEDLTGIELSDDKITSIFEEYLTEYGKFYMHTDSHALHHMGVEESDLENPEPAKQIELLEKLTKAENIGCGHLKLAMKNPNEYGMRPDLIKGMFRAFFKSLWSGNKDVEFVILSGEHKEGAVISVRVEAETVNKETKVPTIKPQVGELGTQTFVYHPQAVEFLRREISEGINKVIGVETGGNVDVEEFGSAMIAKGNKQIEATVKVLAKDDDGNKLPSFEVLYDQSGNLKEVVQQ